MPIRALETTCYAPNERAWAIGREVPFRSGKGYRFNIRRVVWGRLLAREEKREGEKIKRAIILITGK